MYTQYLYVLDYNTCSIVVIKLTKEEEEIYNEDAESILKDHGLDSDECSWMFSDSELEIEEVTND